MRKSFVIVFSLIVIVVLFLITTYFISVAGQNSPLSDNDIRVEKITQKLRKLQHKLKACNEEEKLKTLAYMDGLEMERVLIILADSKEKFKRETWIVTLLYVGLVEESINKGAKLRFLNNYILDRIKEVSIKYCNKTFQDYFRKLIASLETCDGKSGEHYLSLSKCFKEKVMQQFKKKRKPQKVVEFDAG